MKNSVPYELLGPDGQTHVFTSFPVAHADDDSDNLVSGDLNKQQQEHLLGMASSNEEDTSLDEKKYSIWQIEYYQKYFNVNTTDILARVTGSMVPTFNQNFLLNKIRPNPDLYGPFWICTTLMFTIAISGNMYSFLSSYGATDTQLKTDFHKVTVSAFVIIAYWWIMPACLYMIIRSRSIPSDLLFVEILSVYGYSMFVFIPVSILWLVHISFIQWTLVIMSVFLSGGVLVSTFWPTFSQDPDRKVSYIIMGAIVLAHTILAIGFMSYFFHSPQVKDVNELITTTANISTTIQINLANNKTG